MAYCPECGKNIGDVGFCPDCENSINKENDGILLDIGSAWLVVVLLFPVIGLIGGIIYAVEGKRGGTRLIGFSLGWMVLAFIIFMITGAFLYGDS